MAPPDNKFIIVRVVGESLAKRAKMEKKHVLVTGGAGYIGSHTIVEMLNQDKYVPVAFDNLANSCEGSLKMVEEITGKEVEFIKGDVLSKEDLRAVFSKHQFDSVIHFAALKAVGESTEIPVTYYKVNVGGTINLLEVMKEFNVKKFVFSSSATVYGSPVKLPIDENHPVGGCTNPYGKSKYVIEEILQDLCKAEPDWKVVILRYFNPVGAHPSGKIGENPKGIPNNLMPYISQVAVGKRPYLSVFGNDYNTRDGTGIRDYLHVVDLALGHTAALDKFDSISQCKIYNLGTGLGYSVLEVLHAMEKAVGKSIPHKVVDRRAGDTEEVYADPSLAQKELNWKANKNLDQMCEDAWHWQQDNPDGFVN